MRVAWNKGKTKTELPQLSGGPKSGSVPWNKGKKLTEAHRKALCGKRGRIRDTTKMRGRRPWNKIGNGVTPLNERFRKSRTYREWRRKVFERDDFTCQRCGRRGGNLHAHHIRSFALFPNLRVELSNGLTLCIGCHRDTESFGINQWTMQVNTNAS